MKVGICTLGCKVNTYESEYVISKLEEVGYEMGDFNDICDIYIINTCSVTNTSDIKSRKMIRAARRKNLDACVIAMGCFIEANKENIMEELEIDIAIGNKDKSKIIDLIKEFQIKKEKINDTYFELDTKFEDMYISKYTSRTRAFVKIQDGCENFCSYCIIPYVRGKCRSKNMDVALKEIEELVNNGFKEIVLTGIHTGNYGVDIDTNFSNFLKEVVKIKGLMRLRISSIEITELTSDVLDIIKENSLIVDHLHIPIQSASNKVLKLMNRKYDLDYFIERIKEIRKIRPNISITTDIIAGHPGEDEKTFNDSLDIIKKINFTKLHVFPYSLRNGTKSSTMEQVSDGMKKEHTRKLLELSKKLEIDYMKSFIGKRKKILIETTKENYSIGHSDNYLQIKIKGIYKSGDFIEVNIADVEYPYCIGEE